MTIQMFLSLTWLLCLPVQLCLRMDLHNLLVRVNLHPRLVLSTQKEPKTYLTLIVLPLRLEELWSLLVAHITWFLRVQKKGRQAGRQADRVSFSFNIRSGVIKTARHCRVFLILHYEDVLYVMTMKAPPMFLIVSGVARMGVFQIYCRGFRNIPD